jgi:hypothetical protein
MSCALRSRRIAERFQNLVSHDLRALRAAGLVDSRRDGKMMLYALTDAGRALLASVVAGAAQARPFDDDRRARADRCPARRPDAEPGVTGGCSQGASTLLAFACLDGRRGRGRDHRRHPRWLDRAALVRSTRRSRASPASSLFGVSAAGVSSRMPPRSVPRSWSRCSSSCSCATRGEGTPNVLCVYLAAVLVGLLENALFGLWWLDVAAALVVAKAAVKEGRASLARRGLLRQPLTIGYGVERATHVEPASVEHLVVPSWTRRRTRLDLREERGRLPADLAQVAPAPGRRRRSRTPAHRRPRGRGPAQKPRPRHERLLCSGHDHAPTARRARAGLA